MSHPYDPDMSEITFFFKENKTPGSFRLWLNSACITQRVVCATQSFDVSCDAYYMTFYASFNMNLGLTMSYDLQ